MIVYVPKGSSSRFAEYLYDIGRMMSNNGTSSLFTKRDCFHNFSSDNVWYSFDPQTAKIAQTHGIALPATEFIINNPVENDNWKLLGVFPTMYNNQFSTPRLFVDKKDIPSRYNTLDLTCEHCHKNIHRNTLWLFQSKKDQEASIDETHTVHVDKGEYRMVGSTCIEVYTGFRSNEIKRIQRMLNEAQALGQTKVEDINTTYLLNNPRYSLPYTQEDYLAMATELAQVYDYAETRSVLKQIKQLKTISRQPYDTELFAGIIPIPESAKAAAKAIINYFSDDSNGDKLIKNKPLFVKAQKAFNEFMQSSYSCDVSSFLEFYENKPEPLDYSPEEQWAQDFIANDGLPVGTILTISADDVKASHRGNHIIIPSYDIIRLPSSIYYENFDKCFVLQSTSEKFKTIDVEITENTKNSGSYSYSNTSLTVTLYGSKEDSQQTLSGDKALMYNVTKLVGLDGTPYKEPVKPNNKFPDYQTGDFIEKNIEKASAATNGWSEVLDSDGYLYSVYGVVPDDAKSFSATYGKQVSFRGTNKSTLSKVKFSDKTLEELKSDAQPTDVSADVPYLGNIGDEVVIDVKTVYKQASKGKYGDFFIYYIKDTAGHDIKILSPKDNLIPSNIKLLKGTISKQEDYNGKMSTVLNGKGLEVLSLKD